MNDMNGGCRHGIAFDQCYPCNHDGESMFDEATQGRLREQGAPPVSECPADPDGCTPTTCTRNDCPKCGATSNPKDRECYRCGAGLAGAPILRSADLLGDRRGVAIERGVVREYHPGTIEVKSATPCWIIYLDGVRRAVRFSEEAARIEAEGLS